MTWNYYITSDGSELEIYDRGGGLDRTIQNDGSGFNVRREVLAAIEDAAVDEYQANGFSNALLQELRDAIFENIERGRP